MGNRLTEALPYLAAGRAEAVAAEPEDVDDIPPDNGTPQEVISYVLSCARAWQPEARIIGNARAGDIVRVLSALVSAPAAPIDFDDAAYNDGYADGQREATGHGAEVARAVARWLDKHLGKGNWYDEAEEGFTADDVVQALHEVVRDTAAPAAEAEPAPVAWPSGFFAIGGDARLRDCATEGCGQHVSIRVERGGVGSDHCEPCARKIAAALAQSDAAGGE